MYVLQPRVRAIILEKTAKPRGLSSRTLEESSNETSSVLDEFFGNFLAFVGIAKLHVIPM